MKNRFFLIFIASFFGVSASLILANPEHVFAFKPIGPVETVPNGSNNATFPIIGTPSTKNNTATGGGFSFSGNFTNLTQATSTSQPSDRSLSENITVEPPTSSFLSYENTTFGIRVKYPSNWTSYESQNGSSALIVQFAEGPYITNGSYTEETSSGGLAIKGASFTLNSSSGLSLWAHEQLNRFMANLPSFKLVEMKNMTLDSHQQDIPATMTSYNYRDSSNREINAFVINILKDGLAYSLEYSAEPQIYSKNLPILLEMINTFEVTQTPYPIMVIPASTSFKSYENSTNGIRIEYPENWMYKEEKDIVTFDFHGGLFRIGVFTSDYSSSQEAADITVNSLKQSFSDFNLILSEPIKLRGANFTSSNMLVYTVNNDLGSINKEMQIITVHGGKVYRILYGTDLAVYPVLEPTIQKMMDSFQIMDRPNNTAIPTPTPLSSKFDQTYNFNLENGSILPIKYKISGGELTDVILEESRELDGNPTLVASITPTAPKGILLIELPRSLIDSKASGGDQPFYENKWDGMKSGKYKEIESNQWTRTLEIPFAISISGIGESTHVTVVGTEPKL